MLGRSQYIGAPLAKSLLNLGCEVTVCHSKTPVLRDPVAQGEIILSVTGKPNLVKADWISDSAIVFDYGLGQNERGVLNGDVDQKNVIYA